MEFDNTFVIDPIINPLDHLTDYLEEHPEDILKWTEFLSEKVPVRARQPFRHLFLEVLPNGQVLAHPEMEQAPPTAEPVSPLNVSLMRKIIRAQITPLPFKEGSCGICDEPIGSFYSCTLPCSHTYHTDCFMAWDYEHGLECNIQGCTQPNPHAKTRAIISDVKRARRGGLDTIYQRLQKKKDFKVACASLRRAAAKIGKSHTTIQKAVIEERKKVLEFHGDKLNAIQHDMNRIPKKIKESDIYKQRLEAIRDGRKIMRFINRKYRVGMRDMIDHLGMRFTWETRWILERHRTHNYFSSYRAGIRMMPGAKRSWKPSEAKKKPVIDIDTESDTESEGSTEA